MATVNHVTIAGTISRKPMPQLKYFENGIMRAKFTVETTTTTILTSGGRELVVQKHPVIAWQTTIRNIAKLAKADNFVFLTGHLRTIRVFNDKAKMSFPYTFIVANNVQLILQKDEQNSMDRDRP